ncbi:MAG: hypothetical protein V9E94_08600 [Microthrixaceae bacterium]
MDRLMLAIVLAVVVVGIAWLAQRRRPDAPTGTNRGHEAPAQLDRADFDRPDAPWIVVVFSSATCSTCGDVWAKAQVLESSEVAVQQVEATADANLHDRYKIGAVPIVVIADEAGVVVSTFMGPVSATHLWAALAEAREPGSVPPGCGDAHDS